MFWCDQRFTKEGNISEPFFNLLSICFMLFLLRNIFTSILNFQEKTQAAWPDQICLWSWTSCSHQWALSSKCILVRCRSAKMYGVHREPTHSDPEHCYTSSDGDIVIVLGKGPLLYSLQSSRLCFKKQWQQLWFIGFQTANIQLPHSSTVQFDLRSPPSLTLVVMPRWFNRTHTVSMRSLTENAFHVCDGIKFQIHTDADLRTPHGLMSLSQFDPGLHSLPTFFFYNKYIFVLPFSLFPLPESRGLSAGSYRQRQNLLFSAVSYWLCLMNTHVGPE